MSRPGEALVDQPEGVAILCERLASLGATFAAISPGSRSTPLTLALTSSGRIQCLPVIDERSAGFVALGAAKWSGRPALVVTTSGTAAANLAPAVHEAREARVPLIALTADRPPELRGVGEGQTIDQVRLFGSAAAYFELDLGGTKSDWTELAEQAFRAATGHRPGPVQINLSLRPPLESIAPTPLPSEPSLQAPDEPDAESAASDLGVLLSRSSRPLVIAGRDESRAGTSLAVECERLGIPILADTLSGAGGGGSCVQYWDPILRCSEWAERHMPDLVVRTGDMPTSKPLRAWLERVRQAGAAVFQFDPQLARRDPTFTTTHICECTPESVLALITPSEIAPNWLDGWASASQLASEALSEIVGEGSKTLTEPAVASTAYRATVGDYNGSLFVSASMPIRDVESFVAPVPGGVRVLSNRGANGIDGVISTAIGVALAAEAATTLLIGDVALAHDNGSFALLRDAQPDLKIVVVDNGVGTIFDTLPLASAENASFEAFFSTPTRLPLEKLCDAWDLDYRSITSLDQLAVELRNQEPGPRILHVVVGRADGHVARRHAWETVATRLADAPD